MIPVLLVQSIRRKKGFTLHNTSFPLLYQLSAFLSMKNALVTVISHTCVYKGVKEGLSQACFQSYTERTWWFW